MVLFMSILLMPVVVFLSAAYLFVRTPSIACSPFVVSLVFFFLGCCSEDVIYPIQFIDSACSFSPLMLNVMLPLALHFILLPYS